ncbi:GTP pyrophosphokinase [Lachnoclostridium phytofermentans]|uniref:GTP pyrophosphokinase n=1 Tax=Lachnoclostridium phytofermentans TaxID=66219 RepID=UPI000AA511F9|nr:GTP pyrophosphokinase family protein [Lachnoclostridium phytofermentans]
MYHCAIKEIVTKVEILNVELKTKSNRSPIEIIKSRIKDSESIIGKLIRKGFEVNLDSMIELEDIAGVRIICSFLDDIYEVANMIMKQDDITVVRVKDYIKEPKESGYRSLHIIIEIPVFFSDKKQPLKVEVQIRTIAMDFWASLEHQLRYKRNYGNENALEDSLRECADVISDTDRKMQEIKRKIDEI